MCCGWFIFACLLMFDALGIVEGNVIPRVSMDTLFPQIARSEIRISRAGFLNPVTLATAVALSVLSMQPAQAILPDAVLSKKLAAANVLPKGTTHRLIRNDRDLRVEITHYPTLDRHTQKIDALLLARTILHADPGGIDSLITRFFVDSEPGTYHDVLVSNRDIVGADAGIVGSDQLLSGIEVVTIRPSDGMERKFERYCAAAHHALQKNDFRESETLYTIAFREGPDVARRDGKYYAGLIQLAHAYSGREDYDDERRVYQHIANHLPTADSHEALHAVRDAYTYFFNKGEFQAAEKVVRGLIDVQTKGASTPTEDYGNDLQKLAACHRKQGHIAEAKKEYENALAAKQKILGDHHAGLADIYEGLGDCYGDEKNMTRALEYWHKAKVAFDHAALSKDAKHHIPFEVYRATIARLNNKIGPKTRPGWDVKQNNY